MDNNLPKKKHVPKKFDTQGDTICQLCGELNITWYADNRLWNRVMESDGGVLCPSCFIKHCAKAGLTVVFHAEIVSKKFVPTEYIDKP
jgi:hypothetical protein